MSDIEWELDLEAEPQGSSNGFWYDLTDGGYIDLSKLLKNSDQLEMAYGAISLLHSLEVALDNNTLLNEF